jgi:hypothetical protein
VLWGLVRGFVAFKDRYDNIDRPKDDAGAFKFANLDMPERVRVLAWSFKGGTFCDQRLDFEIPAEDLVRFCQAVDDDFVAVRFHPSTAIPGRRRIIANGEKGHLAACRCANCRRWCQAKRRPMPSATRAAIRQAAVGRCSLTAMQHTSRRDRGGRGGLEN